MYSILRQLNLNRIGAGLFVVGLVLLVAGLAGSVLSWASQGPASLRGAGLSDGESVLLDLACFILSAVVFGLAIVNERLARIEAKLETLGKSRQAEDEPGAYRA